ncbi:hypothetical protein AVEN_230048-1 [Araneus ventricosus]|uniref:Uncharacterized protein n=1 Tax=Araneus ventricosus TaxID=182803 RepID=A0A4Y2CWH0_ARAVE|nr:hypothetical protein AVEN_230048-1 [Araneus ventricosus]
MHDPSSIGSNSTPHHYCIPPGIKRLLIYRAVAWSHLKWKWNVKVIQVLNPSRSEATRETNKLLQSNPTSKRTPEEATLRQMSKNRGSAYGSFAPRPSGVSNNKATTYLKIYYEQAKELLTQI